MTSDSDLEHMGVTEETAAAVMGLTEDYKIVTVDPTNLTRMVRWVRTITVTGPEDWVTKRRETSLAEGMHIISTRDGIPCTIEVTATDAEPLRAIKGNMSTAEMTLLRQGMPEHYEKVHGKGTAREHAKIEGTGVTRPNITSEPGHTGQYL